jgi:hypothetical protein
MIQVFLPNSELVEPEQPKAVSPQGDRRIGGTESGVSGDVAGSRAAQARRMYGFEFLGLTDAQREKIKAKCKVLPPFRSLIDI